MANGSMSRASSRGGYSRAPNGIGPGRDAPDFAAWIMTAFGVVGLGFMFYGIYAWAFWK